MLYIVCAIERGSSCLVSHEVGRRLDALITLLLLALCSAARLVAAA